MNYSRIQFIVILLLYFPLAVIAAFNLLYPSSITRMPDFIKEIAVACAILFMVFFIFRIILKMIREKYTPFFVAVFTVIYIFAVYLIAYIGVYQAHDLKSNMENISLIPSLVLLRDVIIMSAMTTVLMLLMGIKRKTIALVFLGLFVASTGLIAGKEIYYKHKLLGFFGGNKKGEIIFISTCSTHKEHFAFSLSDCKFKKISMNEFRKKAQGEGGDQTINKYKIYDYAYDRDDLSKIYVADVETGKTILLTQGESPIWIE